MSGQTPARGAAINAHEMHYEILTYPKALHLDLANPARHYDPLSPRDPWRD
jgi:hypothetical protein